MTQETKLPISNTEGSLTNHVQDLIIPAETSMFDSILTGALILFLVIGLILFGFMFKRCRKSQQVAKRKLKALQRADNSSQSKQETAQQLSALLQTGLGITQLDKFKPQEATKWEDFVKKLETVCYSKSEPSDDDLKSLFEQSYDWLENA